MDANSDSLSHSPSNDIHDASPSPNSLSPKVSPRNAHSFSQLECPIPGCFAIYVRRPRLVDHILTQHPAEAHLHVGDEVLRPFKCPVGECSCAYVRKGDLKAHILKTHETESVQFPDLLKPKSTKSGKSFPCPISGCSCGYKRQSDLKYHFLARHRDRLDLFPEFGRTRRNETCSFPNCGAVFSDMDSLLKHQKQIHNSPPAILQAREVSNSPTIHVGMSPAPPQFGNAAFAFPQPSFMGYYSGFPVSLSPHSPPLTPPQGLSSPITPPSHSLPSLTSSVSPSTIQKFPMSSPFSSLDGSRTQPMIPSPKSVPSSLNSNQSSLTQISPISHQVMSPSAALASLTSSPMTSPSFPPPAAFPSSSQFTLPSLQTLLPSVSDSFSFGQKPY